MSELFIKVWDIVVARSGRQDNVKNAESYPYTGYLKAFLGTSIVVAFLQVVAVAPLQVLGAKSIISTVSGMGYAFVAFVAGLAGLYFYYCFIVGLSRQKGGNIGIVGFLWKLLVFALCIFFLGMLVVPIVLGPVAFLYYTAYAGTNEEVGLIESYKRAWLELREHEFVTADCMMWLVSFVLMGVATFMNGSGGFMVVVGSLVSAFASCIGEYAYYEFICNLKVLRGENAGEQGTGLSAG